MTEYIIKVDEDKKDIMGNCPLVEKPQELVRCMDCIWWGTDRMCENSDSPCFQNGCTHGNWFCADGKRKSADEKLMDEMDADPLG